MTISQQLVERGSADLFDAPVHLLFCAEEEAGTALPFRHPMVHWTVCTGAGEALAASERQQPEALLIRDEGAGAWAEQFCRSVGAHLGRRTPLLFVWQPHAKADVRRLMNAGATDVLEGEFDRAEVLRLWAHLRRQLRPQAETRVLRFGDLSLDLDALRVRRNGRAIGLSALQRRLLEIMLRRPFHVFTREELEQLLWNGRQADGANVRTCMRRLRAALNAPGERPLVCNVRQVGYALDGGDPPAGGQA